MHNPTIDMRLLRYARSPCPFPPGSDEKLAVLTLRASLRLPLFVAGDYVEEFVTRSLRSSCQRR